METLHELRQLAADASRTAAVLREIEVGMPREFTGSDPQATVLVHCDSTGVPTRIRLTEAWAGAVAEGSFEPAVLAAWGAAAAERAAAVWQAWAELDRVQVGWTPPEPEPAPPTRPPVTDLTDLIESVLEVAAARRTAVQLPLTGTGSAAGGDVVVEISQDGITACRVSGHLARSSSATLQDALDQALGAAVRELAAATAAPKPATGLLDELMAHLQWAADSGQDMGGRRG